MNSDIHVDEAHYVDRANLQSLYRAAKSVENAFLFSDERKPWIDKAELESPATMVSHLRNGTAFPLHYDTALPR